MSEGSERPKGYPHVKNVPGAAGVRSVVVAVRLTEGEAADLDLARGALTRSEYLRVLLLRDRKRRAES